MKHIKENLLPISIIAAGVLISASIILGYSLDALQKIFSILGSISIGIALYTYFYHKNRDKIEATIDQISFCRKEVIPEWHKVRQAIIFKNPKYTFSRIKINEPTIDYMKVHYLKNYQEQISIFWDGKNVDANILDSHIWLLNMMEELSLKILHFGTASHDALGSIHSVFVEIVERNAAALIFVKDILIGEVAYSATLELYKLWKDKVDRTYVRERLIKYGFITNSKP